MKRDGTTFDGDYPRGFWSSSIDMLLEWARLQPQEDKPRERWDCYSICISPCKHWFLSLGPKYCGYLKSRGPKPGSWNHPTVHSLIWVASFFYFISLLRACSHIICGFFHATMAEQHCDRDPNICRNRGIASLALYWPADFWSVA